LEPEISCEKQLSFGVRIRSVTLNWSDHMKNSLALLVATAFTFFPVAISFSLPSRPPSSPTPNNAHPVVVELFTSEGCSSCPPADALLLRLENTQPIQGANVIAIEEHVDYWNHQGWTDPYSSSDWTQRQVDYVARLKDKEPYTPQMIVDGQTQVAGTESHVEEVIQNAAAQPQTPLTLTGQDSLSNGEQQFQVRVGKLLGNSDKDTAEVWLAITETGLASSVNAGENAGKDLHHASVLRSLRKIGVAKPATDSAFESSPRVKFKSDWKRQNLQVVVFVQEKKSMHILGATSLRLAS
jgi:hypothetical protein